MNPRDGIVEVDDQCDKPPVDHRMYTPVAPIYEWVSQFVNFGVQAMSLKCRKCLNHKNALYRISRCISSHVHMVVWECCKDDHQSQWEMKFDSQLPLNPLSDRHQIWHAWLRCGYLSPRKNWAQSVKGFLLPIYAKYTPHVRYATLYTYACLLLFLVLPIAYSRDACMDFNA